MEFRNEYVQCKIDIIGKHESINLHGSVINANLYKNVLISASNPIDKRASYHGTGLPFPCADIAFENSQNNYKVDQTGFFDVTFSYPNSYYTVADKHRINPSVFFIIDKMDGLPELIRFELPDPYSLRTLTNRETRKGPEFYSDKYDLLPVDTAEVIMKTYANIKETKKIA